MLESPVAMSRSGSMVLTIKNYGPISRGSIVLKPLTVLIGPNGCGKTHVTTLLHSALKAEGKHVNWDHKKMNRFRDGEINWHMDDVAPFSVLREEAKRIHSHIQAGGTIDSDICKHVAAVWAKSFEMELVRNFSGDFYDRVRAGSEYFELEVASEINRGKFAYKIGLDQKFETVELGNINLEIEFKEYRDAGELASDERLHRDEKTIHVNVPAICHERAVLDALKDGVTARAKSNLKRSVYFPAERSGLMLLIDAVLQKQKGHISKEPPYDRLTGTMADLFSWLSGIDDHKSKFAHMAEVFEADALGGRVVMKTQFMESYIYYILGKNSFSMVEASSSVRDVALFLVYLKHAAEPGDMVILEEPEINLHPDNQVLLARLIARLAAAGLRMVVSTHSPYFLEQLSHCVVGGAILNEKSEKVLPHDECLGIDDVAAYKFVPHDGNYEICPLDVTGDGIPQTEFMNVDEKLYAELTELRQADE